MKRMTAGSGDSFMTGWLKISGFVFCLLSAFFVLGTLFVWYIKVTNL